MIQGEGWRLLQSVGRCRIDLLDCVRGIAVAICVESSGFVAGSVEVVCALDVARELLLLLLLMERKLLLLLLLLEATVCVATMRRSHNWHQRRQRPHLCRIREVTELESSTLSHLCRAPHLRLFPQPMRRHRLVSSSARFRLPAEHTWSGVCLVQVGTRAHCYLLLNLQFQRDLLRQTVPQLLPLPAAMVEN
jgi:hypothetical protein